MAINSTSCDDHNQLHTGNAMSSKGKDLSTYSVTAHSLISSGSANSNYKRRKSKNKSVYLSNNRIHLRSVTEEKSENKVLSSFQLAAKLYKSNSDEFKLTRSRGKKSNKKSVLTLPNEPAALPQSCTVSDMNDSEYFKSIHKPKGQKKNNRQPLQRKRPKPPNYNYEYYDRDADYCSQMNVYLDCSSVDVVRNFKGDGRRKARGYSKIDSEEASPSDVWAVLRNINRFQFYPSPPMSDDSSYEAKPRKKKMLKKKLNRGVYETCRTEEIAYFSNIELNRPRDASPSGSSQITVIDNQCDLNKICKGVGKTSFERNIPHPNSKIKSLDTSKNNNKKKRPSLKSKATKSSDSKDTLVDLKKSDTTTDPKQIFNRGDGTFEESLEKTGFATTEVQTEPALTDKQVDQYDPPTLVAEINPKTISDYITDQNISGRVDAKLPLRRSLQSRIPWCRNSSRPSLPPGRHLTNASSIVILSPPQGLTFSKLQDSPRCPHQATADPMHPLTQTAIRRIVAKIKFPLVILGKDQVSGTFEVEHYDYPQFGGLDEHIWPFMAAWMPKSKSVEHNAAAQNKKQTSKDKRADVDITIRNKERIGVTPNNVECKQNEDKVKPASRFRDNILKLLYKKNSNQNMANDILPNRVQRYVPASPVIIKRNSVGLNYSKTVDVAISSGSISISRPMSPSKTVKPRFSTTPPLPLPTSPSKILIAPKKREKIWGKTKWASDFIENVINKIKCGTYYTSDMQSKNFNTSVPLHNRTSDTSDLKLDSKEVSIQVALPMATEDFTPKVTIQKKKELTIKLPGFDDAIPQLEIKSMTRNQIAVKNCVMNVLVQFDVNVPTETDRNVVPFKRSTSCVPLSITESKTKVFKCKTRILNAALPAELCSILPRMMMQFLDKDTPLALTMQEETRHASLSTISENTMSDVLDPIKFPLLHQIPTSPELIRLSNGRFSKNPKSWAEKSNSNEKIYVISVNELPYKYSNIQGILSLQSSIYRHNDFVEHPKTGLVLNITSTSPSNLPCLNSAPEPNLCTDLVPYVDNKIPYRECTIQNAPLLALKEFFNKMLKCNADSVSEYLPTIQMQTCSNSVYMNFSISNHQGVGVSLCIDASHFKYKPVCSVSTKNSSTAIAINYERPDKRIEYIKHAEIKEACKTETRKPAHNGAINKTRKKGHVRYVKLYKKCKSTSHIVAERSSTPLSKVTNLDEFFQAMGSGKLLSSVVDGSCGKKILACISDLKMYISGITPRQALLVMLLANKKDTSNLVRFRPVILQGIAVNRITRVSELDMEVEVIEKESFNNMSEFMGVPSLIEIPQNNDHLLEELIWIAKTTASDYQRRFDESSERLLKTLLEKRKRLNPSYLRVMARYVGLGLLKTPVKH